MSEKAAELGCAAVADRIARALKGRGVAVWLLGSGAGKVALAHSREFLRPEGMDAAEWQRSVGGAVSRCAGRRSPVRAAWKGTDEGDAPDFLFLPVVQGESVAGVVGFVGGPEMVEAFREHHEILADSLRLLVPGSSVSGGLPGDGGMNAGLASLAVALLTARDTAGAARSGADALRELLGASRVCLFELVGVKWRLVAASGATRIDRHGAEARAILARFALCVEERVPTGCMGGVLAKWHGDAAAAHTGLLVEGAAVRTSNETVLRAAAPLIAHALHEKRPWLRRAVGPQRWLARGIALAVAVVALVLLLRPVHQTFAGRCELVPAVRGFAVAEISGRLDEVLVEDGAIMQKGAAVARLDGSDIESRLEVARQDLRKQEAEARRLQQMGEMADFRIAQLERRRADEEVAKLEEDLRRCTIIAPISGVVLTKDVALRRGEVVEPGAMICELASLSNWDLEIKINEGDAGWLEAALRERGQLPVRYVLQARSDLRLEARVTSDRNVSQMAYTDAGATVLYVTIRGIDLPEGLLAHMRPGFSGMAKIEGVKEPFVKVAFSRLVQWIRLRVLL